MRLLPLFDDGAVFKSEHGFRILRAVRVGELDVVDGLVVADPWDLDERAPIAAPRGRHRVELAVACWDVAAEVAAIRVVFREAKVSLWRRVAEVTTDSATLAITDAGTGARVARSASQLSKREAFVEALVASMEDAPAGCGRLAIEGGAVLAVATGRDGGFSTWLGVDEGGEPVSLVVDLATLDPATLRRWKPAHGEAPPATFGPEFLRWIEAVGARFDEPLVSGPPLEGALVTELARVADATPARDLVGYYALMTPLSEGTTLSSWLELRAALPARARGAWWPVRLRDARSGIVARSVDGEIVEVADFDGGGIFLSAPDLRTFFVNQALTLFGEEI